MQEVFSDDKKLAKVQLAPLDFNKLKKFLLNSKDEIKLCATL